MPKVLQSNKQLPAERSVNMQRVLWVAAIVVAVPSIGYALLDQWAYWSGPLSRGQPLGRDAYNFWTAARLCRTADCVSVYDSTAFAAAQRALLGPTNALNCFLYPPSALLVMGWLSVMPYGAALFAWSLLGLTAFVVAVAAPRFDKALVLLCLLSPMLLFNLIMGQTGLLCAALLIGGLRLSGHRPILAGLLIGLLSFKPVLGVLIPPLLLWRRQWTTFFSAVVTTVILALLPAMLWGWDIWRAFFEQAVPLQQQVLHHGSGIGVWMIPSTFNSARLLGWDTGAAYALHGVVALLAIVLMLTYAGCSRIQRAIGATDLLLVALATCLISPYIHNYDFSLLEGALIVWVGVNAGRTAFRTTGTVLVIASLWAVGLLSFLLNAGSLPVAPAVLLLVLAGLVSWWRKQIRACNT